MNDEDTLSFECDLDEPPARVWRALTEPALLAAWLMDNDFAPEAGHEFTFREDRAEIACKVLEIEPENVRAKMYLRMVAAALSTRPPPAAAHAEGPASRSDRACRSA